MTQVAAISVLIMIYFPVPAEALSVPYKIWM